MNRFRRILVRWEKRAESYLAMLRLACGIINWRATGAGIGSKWMDPQLVSPNVRGRLCRVGWAHAVRIQSIELGS